MDDFIEDSYLDPTAENGSHNTSQNASISAQSPSSFFTIDSDSDNGKDNGFFSMTKLDFSRFFLNLSFRN